MTWDPNPEPNITAYRVFIGTAAGSYRETFDVPGAQTSFVYSKAVVGRRYYVVVAAQANHTVWGPRSAEISGIATAAPPSDLSSSPPALSGPVAAAQGFSSPSVGGAATPAAGSLQVIATGLEPVTALAVSASGVGLLVEGGRAVRVFQRAEQGVQVAPALMLDDDAQIQDVALDPAFDRTGRAFLAVSRTGRDGAREVAIERHRLLGGALGESLAVVPALDGSVSARTLLAITRDGRVVVAQPGLVRAFAGTAATVLGEGPAKAASLTWDEINQAAWLTGISAGGAAILERLGGTGTTAEVMPLPASLADIFAVAPAGAPGRIAVGGASGVALVQFDPATGAATILTADLVAYGTPVLVTAPTGDDASWYVVLRAARPGGSSSDTLVRVPARSGAPRPIH